MPTGDVVELARKTLEIAVWLAAPLLVIATVVSLAINLVQVLTSLQDATLSAVPRLAAVAVAVFLLLPWMARRLGVFTLTLFSDFRPYLR
ncbi:MAG: flagellar biosynthetic protein FliQ [Terriglobales bacterium]|jgi:flagellar biosynthetic protein FliQ|nr:flagellar biosynthetic protein FliQ [Terriglobales bacterium]